MAEAIPASDLMRMDDLAGAHPLRIDLVYASADHPENIFGAALYRQDAPFLLHRHLAAVTVEAARRLRERHGWTLVLKDGLRPVEAQTEMMETPIVRANPHWLTPPRLLSPPGAGAHPRGMAVDVSAEDGEGEPVDMGTAFDTMDARSARAFADFPEAVLLNRKTLENAFLEAGAAYSVPIVPLASEWWDFRVAREVYERYAPMRDADLPEPLRMTGPCQTGLPAA